MGYESWESKKISPTSIYLDPENPRLPSLPANASQEDIRSELFDTSKVREMVKSIAKSGFFPDQTVVVVKKESGRGYVVVEGNRRVCACQALLKPEKTPEKHARVVKRWSLKADEFKDSFSKIPVVVAPSRISAIRLMASRHLNDAPVMPWSRYAQGRFAINAFSQGQSMGEVIDETGLTESEVKRSIQEARVFELYYALDWSDEERSIILNNLEKFPFEVLRRILRSSKTQEKFGEVSFDEDGWLRFGWGKECLTDTLKRFLYDSHPALVQDKDKIKNSRNLNNAEQVEEYLNNLPDELKPSPSSEFFSARDIVPDPENSEVPTVPPQSMSGRKTPDEKRKSNRKKKEPALPSDLEVSLKNDKAKVLVEELQTIIPETMPYATGLLLRSLLEISLIARVKKVQQWRACVTKYQKGKSEIPTLDSILKFSESNEVVITDASLRRTLSNQQAVPKKLLNLVVHNDTHIFTPSEAREAARKMTPLFRHLLHEADAYEQGASA